MNRYSVESQAVAPGALPSQRGPQPGPATHDAWSPLGRASVGALLAAVAIGAPGLGEAFLVATVICFAGLGLTIVESTRPRGGSPSTSAPPRRVAPAIIASVAVFVAAIGGSLVAALTGSPSVCFAVAGLALVILIPLMWIDERSR